MNGKRGTHIRRATWATPPACAARHLSQAPGTRDWPAPSLTAPATPGWARATGSGAGAGAAARVDGEAGGDAVEVALGQLGRVDLRGLRDVELVDLALVAALPQRDLDVQVALELAVGELADQDDLGLGRDVQAVLAQRGLGVAVE